MNEHTAEEDPSKHELPRGIRRETQTQSVENGGWGLSCWVVQREMFWTLHGHWRVVIQGEAVQRGFWELCIWGLWQTMSNWLEVVDMGHKKLFKGLTWETKRLFLEDCKSIVLKSCDVTNDKQCLTWEVVDVGDKELLRLFSRYLKNTYFPSNSLLMTYCSFSLTYS